MTLSVPPNSVEAERAVLGCLFLDNSRIATVLDSLYAEDFYLEPHREVFKAIERVATQNKPADWVTVTEALKASGKLEKIGGPAFLTELADAIPSVANMRHYVEVVREKSQIRQTIANANKVLEACYKSEAKAHDVRETFQKLALEASGARSNSRSLETIGEILPRTLGAMQDGQNQGVSSGLANLDRWISGFRSGDLYVVGGRPSMGKSAFAKDISVAACHSTAVAIFSLEMSKNQLVERYLARECKINLHRLRCGNLSDAEWEKIQEIAGELSEFPIIVDDTPGITIPKIRFRLREAILRTKLAIGMIIVDYMQLQKSETRYGSENDRIAAIANGLKGLAKEFDASVVALSQLNREVEKRPKENHGRKPMVSDLRGSGGIEEAADVITLLYRPEVYLVGVEEYKGIAYANVAKHRNGPCGEADLWWDETTATFSDRF